MASDSYNVMNEITNEGDGEGPGCLMALVIVAACTIAAIIAMAGYTLAQ